MTDQQILISVGIFFSALWFLCLISFFKQDLAIDLAAKYFQWSAKAFGFEADVRPTPKAKIIYRYWNLFMLLILTVFIFFIFSGKLK